MDKLEEIYIEVNYSFNDIKMRKYYLNKLIYEYLGFDGDENLYNIFDKFIYKLGYIEFEFGHIYLFFYSDTYSQCIELREYIHNIFMTKSQLRKQKIKNIYNEWKH